LLKTKEKAQKLKDELTQYRDDVEDYYNSLLYQSWMLISDRNNLDNKTKSTLNEFPYIHSILKNGSINPVSPYKTYDDLIADHILNKKGCLGKVFDLYEKPGNEFTEPVLLTKILLPKKKKIKAKE